jgi:hypothetical protein
VRAARGRCGGVVGGNTARWDVLSENTSTPASVRITIDAWAGNVRQPTKSAPPAKQGASLLAFSVKQLRKNKLVSGVLTIVLGAMVLAWPGPSTLVVSTIFGVA